MWVRRVAVIVFCVIITGGYCASNDFKGFNFVTHTLSRCMNSNESFACISNKVARAIERSMDWDIALTDGMTLVRNNETINHRQARLLGFDRLSQAVQNFFQTHVISLELGGARQLRRGGRGKHQDDSFGGGYDHKEMKKEKKYMQYAFMVLLGIFGLTGPLMMKMLGIMAAHALVSAKSALIIIGSVALKKLFERERQEPIVQVHTIDKKEEEYEHKYGLDAYDRNYNSGYYYNNPYRSYDDSYYTSNVARSNKF